MDPDARTGIARMISELNANQSHIGWFQTGISFDSSLSQEFEPLLSAFQAYDSNNLTTLQLEYCRFRGDSFRLLLEALSPCPNLRHIYLTHDDHVSEEILTDFIRSNELHLKSLDLDTTSTSLGLTEIGKLIAEDSIDYLSCGSSMGLHGGKEGIKTLADAQVASAQPSCFITTSRLLPNVKRYHGFFKPKTETEIQERNALEAIVHTIEDQNWKVIQRRGDIRDLGGRMMKLTFRITAL